MRAVVLRPAAPCCSFCLWCLLTSPCFPCRPPHRQINENDVCLTLTSGGCNSLHLCINGARKVGCALSAQLAGTHVFPMLLLLLPLIAWQAGWLTI